MTGTEMVTAEARALAMAAPGGIMSDDEIQRTYRVAQALAVSNIYKDVTRAEQAFAKLLIGRTLGLNEHQSLSLYVMDGKVEVPYQMLGHFIRSREGYDYRVAWIKEDPEHGRVAIPVDEDDLVDMREIVGCAVEFTVDGETRGVYRWTVEDSERAGLTAPRGQRQTTSLHVSFPRNMYLARCLSNGVKAFVPEVLAGVPVYTEGELPRQPQLGAGEGSGAEPGWGDVPIEAAHEVDKIIRRAERLGHAGLANRATWQMKLAGQGEDAIRARIQEAYDELAVMQRTRDAEPEGDPSAPVPHHTPIDRDDATYCVVCGVEIPNVDVLREPCPGGTLLREPESVEPEPEDVKAPTTYDDERSALLTRLEEAEAAGADEAVAEINAMLDALDAEGPGADQMKLGG